MRDRRASGGSTAQPVDECRLRRDGRRARAPRPRRRGLLGRRPGRVRPPPAVDHRRRRLAAADGTRPTAGCTSSFNGEIFNYRELRRGLLDYPFRTGGDTEVLLAALADWRHGCRRAAAAASSPSPLHDRRRRHLWLVRDRLGVLPLYYYADAACLAVRLRDQGPARRAAGAGPASTRPASTTTSPAARCPPPHTLFQGVTQAAARPPRCGSRRGWALRARAYWAIPAAPARTGRRLTRRDAVDAGRTRCTARRAPPWWPTSRSGAYLSGGVDSSLIVALMSRAAPAARVETFSAGFGDPRYDELPVRPPGQRARRHASTTRSPCAPRTSRTCGRELTWHRDAPMSEPADVAVSRLAPARPVSTSRSCCRARAATSCSPATRSTASPRAVGARPASSPPRLRVPLRRTLAATAAGSGPRGCASPLARARRAPPRRSGSAPGSRRSPTASGGQLARARVAARRARDALAPADGDLMRRMLDDDCGAWLSDNLLERGDRMSMAASLELRPPFLDHRLVELGLPPAVRRQGARRGRPSGSSRRSPARYLPADDRRPAQGRLPGAAGRLVPRRPPRPWPGTCWPSPTRSSAQVFDRAAVRALLERHERGHRQRGGRHLDAAVPRGVARRCSSGVRPGPSPDASLRDGATRCGLRAGCPGVVLLPDVPAVAGVHVGRAPTGCPEAVVDRAQVVVGAVASGPYRL